MILRQRLPSGENHDVDLGPSRAAASGPQGGQIARPMPDTTGRGYQRAEYQRAYQERRRAERRGGAIAD